ncbi:hypothetical protein [Burkholderia pseudomallei]|uniref:hypothetical protein n=1 Tax=Burkholderia pseudomallei TaxID=28450 RepID=UPI000A82524D|nr:hypothetical protein [Burkholderia pseudomallei]
MLLPRFGGRTMLVTPTADRRPPTADRRPPTVDRRSPTADHGRASAALRTFRAKQNGRA